MEPRRCPEGSRRMPGVLDHSRAPGDFENLLPAKRAYTAP